MSKAVVLLSGGLDSSTVFAIAKANGFSIYALSFDYGQRHQVELEAAQAVASNLGAAEHRVMELNLRAIGGSALTDEVDVPKHRSDTEIAAGIPITYVPARNTVFLSYALAWAEVLGTGHIFVGVNALDYSGYPDCRPEYIEAYQAMANLATKGAVNGQTPIEIHAPLIHLSKAEIITLGTELGVDYGLTSSCYDPGAEGAPCSQCDSCLLRAKGFSIVGLPDPLLTRFHGENE